MQRDMGCPDKPVASISEDLFNVSTYVDGLCTFVNNCDTPMTISIQGDWGSGKTSMMNMMRENLKTSIWPIWFNTWQFSQFDMGNSLVFSMMDVLLKGLDCDPDVIKKVLCGVAGVSKNLLRVLADKAAGGVVEGLLTEAMNGGTSTDYAREVLELKTKFQEAVNKKLSKENKERVVIFVDDLDRLQPGKAVELLEVLKLFLDCEKCVFVLAVDYEVVTLGIKEKFGSNVSEEKGKSFFDKIIQLPFKMPVAQYDINKYVGDMMKKMDVETNEKEVKLFSNLIRTSIGYNPRSMKRLFNTYQLLDIISKSAVRDIDENVRKRVLFAIVCAQMHFDEFYLFLASSEIEAEVFEALATRSEDNKIFEEIYSDVNIETTEERKNKLCQFIPYFIDSLQVDNDQELSEEELNNLRIMLKCSVVTSVKADTDDKPSGKDWEYRYKNKDIVIATASLLTDVGKFVPWLPRKNKPDRKIYEVSGYYTYMTVFGFKSCLEYFLTRIDENKIGCHICIILQEGKGKEKLFFETYGANPIYFGENKTPIIEDWGRYRYYNVLTFDVNDSSAPEQIADVVRKSYKELTKNAAKAD